MDLPVGLFNNGGHSFQVRDRLERDIPLEMEFYDFARKRMLLQHKWITRVKNRVGGDENDDDGGKVVLSKKVDEGDVL